MFFVGIGAQRSATTWLWNVLQRHTQVALSPVKELHYFSEVLGENLAAPFRKQRKKQTLRAIQETNVDSFTPAESRKLRQLALWLTMEADADYKEYFQTLLKRPQKTCAGEFTPAYSLLPQAGFERILAVFPETRFIFVMRNPIDRAWSNVRFRQQQRGESATPEQLLEQVLEPGVIRRSAYEETLSALLGACPREQVHLAFMEELTDPTLGQTHLAELHRFLELPHRAVGAEEFAQRPATAPGCELPAEALGKLAPAFRQTYDVVLETLGRLPQSWAGDSALAREGGMDAELHASSV